MNRRGFLRFLFTAPILGPIVLKSLALAEPAIRFVSPTASTTVNRWATQLWLEMPKEIYWGKFMRDDGMNSIIETIREKRGDRITFTVLRKLDEPK